MILRKVGNNETDYQIESKKRLNEILKTKMTTIMIGAISAIEEEFEELFGKKNNRTLQQQKLYDAFIRCRSKILDKGNLQIRNTQEELNQYVVDWKRCNYVIGRENEN